MQSLHESQFDRAHPAFTGGDKGNETERQLLFGLHSLRVSVAVNQITIRTPPFSITLLYG
jgi:hypothetical protein